MNHTAHLSLVVLGLCLSCSHESSPGPAPASAEIPAGHALARFTLDRVA